MDLSLTSDFDSSLLNCWDEEDDEGEGNSGAESEESDVGGQTPAPAPPLDVNDGDHDGGGSDNNNGEGQADEQPVGRNDGAGDGREGSGRRPGASCRSSRPSALDAQSAGDCGGSRSGAKKRRRRGDRGSGPNPCRSPSPSSDNAFLRLPSFGLSNTGGDDGEGRADASRAASAAVHDLHANMEAALAGVVGSAGGSQHGLPPMGRGECSGGEGNDRSCSSSASSSSPSSGQSFPQHLLLSHGQVVFDPKQQTAQGSNQGFLSSNNPISAVAPAPAMPTLVVDAGRSKSIITQRMHEGSHKCSAETRRQQQQAKSQAPRHHKPAAARRKSGGGRNGGASVGSSKSGVAAATISTASGKSDSSASALSTGSSTTSKSKQQQQQNPTIQMHPLAMPSSSDCPPHLSGSAGAAFMTTPGMPAGQATLPFMYNPLFMQTPVPPTNVMAMFQQQQQLPPSMQAPSAGAPPQGQQPAQQQEQMPASDSVSGGGGGGGSGSQTPPPAPQAEAQPQAGSGAGNSSNSEQSSSRQQQDQSQAQAQQQQAQAQQQQAHQQAPLPPQQQQQQQHQQPLPPFLLFDAPCELRTNFLQSQRMHNLPVPSSIAGDNNSFHYGMAVNGFHPQLNARVNPILPLAGSGAASSSGGTAGSAAAAAPPVQLVDGRHNRSKIRGVIPTATSSARSGGNGKERNEREQRRAQKIAELIEKLRLSMVKGGWKVEMKSKYHTLSTCADYVKHLIKTTKEKEAAVEKAKTDLSIKEQKLEEDKALQESRSDPESVTSSLTASTAGSCTGSDEKDNKQSSSSATGVDGAPDGNGGSSSSSGAEDKKSSGRRPTANDDSNGADTDGRGTVKRKKVRLTNVNEKGGGAGTTGDDGTSSMDSSSGEEGGSGGPGGKNISLDKMSSSVSDMTDSNRSSSDGTGGGGNGKGGASGSSSKKRSLPSVAAQSSSVAAQSCSDADDDTRAGSGAGGQPSSSSISSTAAVARGGSSRERRQKHADVVIKQKDKESSREDRRKRKHRGQRECTSLDRDFELDYEEVFLTSNVPQLIATPAGRIVTWNDFFLRVTGLTDEEAKRLSIFSIVQADKLSTLFELVANALRTGAARALSHKQDSNSRNAQSLGSTDREGSTRSSSSSSSGRQSRASITDLRGREFDYSAITLPCIQFPSNYPCKDSHKKLGSHGSTSQESDLPIPLYMTVTLMTDDDPRKRCFHCVLTDSPGTDGQLGSVTPELLAMLFTEHPPPDEQESETATEEDMQSRAHKKQRVGERGETRSD